MSTNVLTKQFDFKNLSLSEQLLFLLNSESAVKESPFIEEKKHNAILGAILADLFLLKKVGLVDNKVVVTTVQDVEITYLNAFIQVLRSSDEKKYMSTIIAENRHIAQAIEKEVLEKLLAEDWIVEKKSKIPFIGQDEIKPEDNHVVKEVKSNFESIIDGSKLPDRKEIYLLGLLKAINALSLLLGDQKLDEEINKQVNAFMQTEYLSFMIYEAIKNQTEQELEAKARIPLGYMAGMYGLGPMYK